MCIGLNVSKIVTTFLLNTCRLPPWPSKRNINAAVECARWAGQHPANDKEVENIPLITGSVAEFYIEPMLPLVGDIDIMYNHDTMLAIPRGHPPPTQLPAEFHNYVKVFEIIDSYLPGYVYLELRYLLTQCIDDDKYNDIEYDKQQHALNSTTYYKVDGRRIQGPAMITDFSNSSRLSVDHVMCVRCLLWPSQAAGWPTRHRNYGWPDSATLDRVVNNECDVVGVAHRQCRQHEWMGTFQWRLILTSRNYTDKQLDASTTDCLSSVTIFRKDRAINRLC